jgi:hypothetical protein
MRTTRFLIVTLLVGVAHQVHAGGPSDCLMSLSATATNATVSRGGRLVEAPADASGTCTFTLTACVNDTSDASCSAGEVNQLRMKVTGRGIKVDGLQQALQAQLPTTQRTCSQTTVSMGQTLHGRLLAAVGTSDGRRDADALILNCQCGANGTAFRSTFEGIQKQIFEQHGCTQLACHGAAKQGGLDLSPDVAYQNILEVPSTESSLNLVQPGDKDRSYLWLKLAAKTDPTLLPPGFQIAQQPMPYTLPALSPDELEAVRLWIYGGAPQTGTIPATEPLLKACLPPAEPITIKPLDPPPPSEGIQFVMPPWKLEAHSEHEICFATYYDLTAQVPQQFQDPMTGTLFRFSGSELRQDPQSHHLILNRAIFSADQVASLVHDPSFGAGTCNGGAKPGQVCDPTDPTSCGSGTCTPSAWTCNGGEKAGQICEPTDLTSCGSGICTSAIQQSFACLGFGPPAGGGVSYYAIGGAQKAQADTEFAPGVFAQIPMKGILYWNSHAFNLTDSDTMMHARLNYYFAKQDSYPVQPIFDTDRIFGFYDRQNRPLIPPFTTNTICNDFVLPRPHGCYSQACNTGSDCPSGFACDTDVHRCRQIGSPVCNASSDCPSGTECVNLVAQLFDLSSHTHKHGKHFTISVPTGTDGSCPVGATQETTSPPCPSGVSACCGLYDSFVYNDPADRTYNPPLAFDSEDPTQRTVHYCSLYNNGCTAAAGSGTTQPTCSTKDDGVVDGIPDPTLVMRRSLIPPSAINSYPPSLCKPVACATGKIGAPCSAGFDRVCDSTPGANDGSCDACPITGGESTQNEMFILIGSYYLAPPTVAATGTGSAAALAVDTAGRSLSSEVVLPPQLGCSSSHAGHAMHASHQAN